MAVNSTLRKQAKDVRKVHGAGSLGFIVVVVGAGRVLALADLHHGWLFLVLVDGGSGAE